jgi:glycosyltransferase involved in cell wall biosynthesis
VEVVNPQSPVVAVLLATYNSSSFIAEQIASLRQNATPFTLHWLDDHSSDNTRQLVEDLAAQTGIDLVAWHQPERLGVPGAFFELLECVQADIYLFCDHDDIWQPGKLDATVAHLLPDVSRPVLCFSEPLVFDDGKPGELRPYFELTGVPADAAQALSRAFSLNPAIGNTVAFTEPLRQIYLGHDEIARSHAVMHDWWMYLLALSLESSNMLREVPTTLYRQHRSNAFGVGLGGRRRTFALMWERQQRYRRLVARQARGFVLAAPGLTQGPALGRLVAAARLIGTLDRRQNPLELAVLMKKRALLLPWRRALWLALVCAVSDAPSQ